MKTKIVCTIGPASCDKNIIFKMIDGGMNVARLNFSHGTYADHAKKIALLKEIREQKCVPLPIMLDTKGPEFRIKTFAEGKITLKEGDMFTFTTEDIIGDKSRVSVTFEGLCEQMRPGDKILLNTGLMEFEVVQVDKPNVICKTVIGGELSDRKSMYFPDKALKLTYLSEQDKADIKFGAMQGVDFFALSFVSRAQDILDVREWLEACGSPKGEIELIAKIENREGVNNLEEILEVADGIIVARGDLGVEVPYEELPAIQKKIIKTCRIHGKSSLIATEMLESMIYNSRPTRAEISDVANAVFDGASAIMLTGESAEGAHPVEATRAMAKIAHQAEKNTDYMAHIDDSEYKIENNFEALSHSAYTLAKDVDAKAIVICTDTCDMAKTISRYHSMTDMIGITTDEREYRKLALSWGVVPVISGTFNSIDQLFDKIECAAASLEQLKKGDNIVVLSGKTQHVLTF